MRILVVGAGAIGGYFGGRLLQAGRDVTFLVREQRAAQLRQSGLSIRSKTEAVHLPDPPTILAAAAAGAIRPGAAELQVIRPGSGHRGLSARRWASAARFCHCSMACAISMRSKRPSAPRPCWADAALFPRCSISKATFCIWMRTARCRLAPGTGLGRMHWNAFSPTSPARVSMSQLSQSILQEMWDKWVFIAAAAGITCLMRAAVGDIVQACGSGAAARDARGMPADRRGGAYAGVRSDAGAGAPLSDDRRVPPLRHRCCGTSRQANVPKWSRFSAT